MSLVGQLAEADAADVKIAHVPSLAATQLAASNDATSILWGARCAHLD